MFAVIKTGGKQYRVKPDDVIRIERIAGAAGDEVAFDSVLMLSAMAALKRRHCWQVKLQGWYMGTTASMRPSVLPSLCLVGL